MDLVGTINGARQQIEDNGGSPSNFQGMINRSQADAAARFKELTGYDNIAAILDAVQRGSISALEAENLISKTSKGGFADFFSQLFGSQYTLSKQQEQTLNNMLAQQSANTAYDFEREQSQTSILDAARQYQELGIPVGSASYGNMASAAPTADFSKSNIAAQSMQTGFNITKSLLSMVGSMAAAGIYGSAISSVKHSAAKMAMQTAHSAETVDYKKLIFQEALKSSFENQKKNY